MILTVTAEKRVFTVEEEISGKISITLDKPTKFSSFSLKVRAVESVDMRFKFFGGASGQDAVTQPIPIEVDPFIETIVPAGDYSSPFRIALDPKFQPSMKFTDRRVDTKISYQLVAQVNPSDQQHPVIDRYDFAVAPALPDGSPAQPCLQSVNREVFFLKVINKGKCEVAARLDKSTYTVFEDICMSMYVKNKSHYNVTSLRCELRQCFVVKPSRTSSSFEDYQKITSLMKVDEWVCARPGADATHEAKINIPMKGLIESVRGRIITCQHYVNVAAMLNSGALGITTVELRLPIKIVAYLPSRKIKMPRVELRVPGSSFVPPRNSNLWLLTCT